MNQNGKRASLFPIVAAPHREDETIGQAFVRPWESVRSKASGDVRQDNLDDMRVVADAELVGDGQEQRVGFRNGLVLLSHFTKT
jgi:hypothetical protein